ncbi:MAG: LPS assembly lipoprotein LptE [Gemmatimonadota bacterium]|nr:LPS assembly lipoprotein LptE [Gemmatimonadota bacterium]
MPPSGDSLRHLVFVLALLASGCVYGFAGGGLPPHIRTVAVLPFENETPATTLQQELLERMRREIQSRLGLRDAPEGRADAVVRGRIVSYDADIPIAYSADRTQSTTARRRLRITVDVEIVDQANDRVLWSRRALPGEGDYNERSEGDGRRQAIDKLVSDVIAGAQSQW